MQLHLSGQGLACSKGLKVVLEMSKTFNQVTYLTQCLTRTQKVSFYNIADQTRHFFGDFKTQLVFEIMIYQELHFFLRISNLKVNF